MVTHLPPSKGAQQPPTFAVYGCRQSLRINRSPCLLWPNGWMDQEATWYGDWLRPRRHCVRWGPSSPEKGGTTAPTFRPMYCGQTTGWIKMPLGTEAGLGPGHIVLDGDPALPLPPKGAQQPASFRSMCIVAKLSPISAAAELLFIVVNRASPMLGNFSLNNQWVHFFMVLHWDLSDVTAANSENLPLEKVGCKCSCTLLRPLSCR